MNFLKLVLVAELIAASFSSCPIHAAEGLVFSGLGLTPQNPRGPWQYGLTLMARVGNTGTEPLAGTIVAHVEQLPYLQFARRVRLEPGEQRSLELFILLPEVIENIELSQHLNIVATLYVRDGDRDVILQIQDGQPATQTLALLAVLPKDESWAFKPHLLQRKVCLGIGLPGNSQWL